MSDQAYCETFRLERDEVYAKLQSVFGMRASPRLTAEAQIVAFFSKHGQFTRHLVAMHFSDGRQIDAAVGRFTAFNERTLDRALAELEAGGVVECTVVNQKGKDGGGAVYRIRPAAEWHKPNADTLEERKNRHGRGMR